MADDFMDYVRNEILKGFPPYAWKFFDNMAGIQGRSERTIKAYALDIRCFFDYLIKASPLINGYGDVTMDFLNNLSMDDIQEYMSYLRSGKRYDGKIYKEDVTTRSRRLSALKSFLQYYVQTGCIKMNVARLVDNPKIPTRKKGRLSDEEVSEMLDHIAEGDVGSDKQKAYLERSRLRDYAIITLLSLTGIRVSELVNLDIDDIDFRNLQINVTRKGGKEEIVLINEETADALQDYIENERYSEDKAESALFLSSRTKVNSRLSVSAVERLVKKFGKTVTAARVTPHTMRRTFGTKLFSETGDIYLVAEALGHSDIRTSSKHYVEMPETRKALIRKTSYHSQSDK